VRGDEQITIVDALMQTGITRTQVLEMLEEAIGDSPKWSYVRSRILGIFGERGLQGKLRRMAAPIGDQEGMNGKASKVLQK
jgi:hypothetical protein